MQKRGEKKTETVVEFKTEQLVLPEIKKDLLTEKKVDENSTAFVDEKIALKKGQLFYSNCSAKNKNKNLKKTSIVKNALNSHQLKIRHDSIFAKATTEEEQKLKMAEAEQSASKKSSKKSKLTNLIFFFVNIAVVAGILVYQLSKEEFAPLSGLKFNFIAIIIALLFFGLTIFSETLTTSYLMKISTGKWRFVFSYKLTYIGRYYDCVTPMATGGQPFQITYLKSHGVPLHTSLSIPLGKYIFGQIAWFFLSIVCLIYSFVNPTQNTFVSITSIIGFVLGSVLLVATVFLCVCKSFGHKLVVKTLKLLYKMKIIKNYDKQYEKITKYISDFQDVMQQYAKSPKDFFIIVGLSIIKMIFIYSTPFFVISFFNGGLEGSMFIPVFVMCYLVDIASSFFPLPGGTGMNEISFAAAFGSIVGQNNILVWVLLGWRFFSYYIYLLQGIIILSYDFSIGNRKYKWLVCKENLKEESNQFKQMQIDKFRKERLKRRSKNA